jgi:hypothetical protein
VKKRRHPKAINNGHVEARLAWGTVVLRANTSHITHLKKLRRWLDRAIALLEKTECATNTSPGSST